MRIGIQDSLSPEDAHQLFEWGEAVFPAEGRGYTWSKTSHHVVASDKGEAIGHIGFGRFTICGDLELSVIGIGGVVVRPEFQGRHIPERMFEKVHTTDVLDAVNSRFALFCPQRLVTYYQRHGYQPHEDGFSFQQEGLNVQTDMFQLMLRGRHGLKGHLKVPSNPW